MSGADTIRNSLQKALATVGRTWQIRLRTSAPNQVSQWAWGAWIPYTGCVFTQLASSMTHDEATKRLITIKSASLRIPYPATSTPPLFREGDQAMDPSGNVWAFDSVLSSGEGSVRFQIKEEVTYRAQGNRGGGL